MTSNDFCNWLKGFLEIAEPEQITEAQVECIKRHLAMVFIYEIDPSIGNKKMQDVLQKVHDGITVTHKPVSPDYCL
jgi:hypothetical protein